MKTGIIYKAISPSEKIYIGRTIMKLSKRRNTHYSQAYNKNSTLYNTAFYRAIRKYGKDNISWEVIYKNIPESYLGHMEIITIELYNTYSNGYNSTKGGEGIIGYRHSDETKAKISKRSKEYWAKEGRIALSGKNSTNYGKSFSREHRAKMSIAHMGISSGENNPSAKLTLFDVKEIKEKYIPYEYPASKLAKEYSISKSAIYSIINNKTWKK